MAWHWEPIANIKGPPGTPGNDVAVARFEALERRDVVLGDDVRIGRLINGYSQYAGPTTDKDGYISGGVMPNGVWNFEKPLTMMGASGVIAQPINSTEWVDTVTDRDGYVIFGIRPDGSVFIGKGGAAGNNSLQAANDALGYTRSDKTRIVVPGDSLSAGYDSVSGGWAAGESWPERLQTLLGSGVTVHNESHSGWCGDEINIAIGALPFDVSIVGGTIPASGPVTLTTTQVIGWTGDNTRTFPGTLAGVPGTIRHADTLTFTRTTSGTAVTAAGVHRYMPSADKYRNATLGVYIGRNDYSNNIVGTESNVVDHVVAATRRLVDYLDVDLKAAFVMGTTTTQSETSGTPGHANVLEGNRRLKEIYGPRFLDIRRYLIDKAIYDLGITPTSGDLTAMNADTLPPSIMADGTHFTKATAGALAQYCIFPFLTTRKWV